MDQTDTNKSTHRLSLSSSIRSRITPFWIKRSSTSATPDLESQSQSQSPASICEDLSSSATTNDLNNIHIEPSCLVDNDDIWQTTMSIRGMTCSSCVGSIRTGLKDFHYIQKAEISALTHGGTIVFRGKQNLEKIVERIDDMGYDVDLIETVPFNEAQFQTRERIVTLKVTGTHCSYV